MASSKNPLVNIIVVNESGELLTNAQVIVKSVFDKKKLDEGAKIPKQVRKKFDIKSGLDSSEFLVETPFQVYEITVNVKGFESQSRQVKVGADGRIEETFMMGAKNSQYIYDGKMKVPFQGDETERAFSIAFGANRTETNQLIEELKQLGATVEGLANSGIFKVSFAKKKSATKKNIKKIDQLLADSTLVRNAGAVINQDGAAPVILINNIIVEYELSATREEIDTLLRENQLEEVRDFVGTPNKYLLRQPQASGYEILATCEKLIESGLVLSAVPDQYLKPTPQFPPDDFLYTRQWTHPLVNLQEAWQELQGANTAGVVFGDPDDKTYGSADITIGIVDEGIESVTLGATVYPTQSDFAGNVTNGQPKVIDYFLLDAAGALFRSNSGTTNHHGMMCASIAAGNAENTPFEFGRHEGIVGIVPNSKLMGISYALSLSEYSTMYNWIHGLNNGAFAAPIDTVEISNNSWVVKGGATSNNIRTEIKNAAKLVTLFARNGRGGFVVFASANAGMLFSSPAVAASPYIISVGASSLDINGKEVSTPYSNYGPALDVVAPSHDDYSMNRVLNHKPPGTYSILHAGLNAYDEITNGYQSTLDAATTAGSAVIRVVSNANFDEFVAEQVITLGAPGSANFRYRRIDTVTTISTTVLELTLTENVGAVFPAGDPIRGLSGDMPGNPGNLNTTLNNPTAVGSTILALQDTSAFVKGQILIFRNPGDANYRASTINLIYTSSLIQLTAAIGAALPNGIIVRGITNLTTFTTLTAAIAPPAPPAGPNAIDTISVNSTDGFQIGDDILLGVPGTMLNSVHNITAINPAGPTITFAPGVSAAYAIAAPVHIIGGRIRTSLTAAPAAGDRSVTVTSTARFQVGQAVHIGLPVVGMPDTSEARVIQAIPNGTTLNFVSELYYGHNIGDQVFGGNPNYVSRGGGTSAAAPLVCGLLGLILTANPNLSWVEARDILRRTAIPIDVRASSAIEKWTDKAGTNIRSGGGITPTVGVTTNITAVVNTRTIGVNSVAGFKVGMAIEIGTGASQEYRVIQEIDTGANEFRVNTLMQAHNPGDVVNAGLIPWHSQKFGHGRVDARQAVMEALRYSPDFIDLMTRDFLRTDAGGMLIQDDGTTLTNNNADRRIQSPDIWTRNTNDPAAVPPNYDEDGPHQSGFGGIEKVEYNGDATDLNDLYVKGVYTGGNNSSFTVQIRTVTGAVDEFRWKKDTFGWSANMPIPAGEMLLQEGIYIKFGATTGHTKNKKWRITVKKDNLFVYARVRNRGNGDIDPTRETKKSLDAWVRFYIALSDGAAIAPSSTPFPFPGQWQSAKKADSAADGVRTNTGVNQTYFLKEEFIPADTMGPTTAAIPAGATNTHVVKAEWDREDLPPSAALSRRVYLLTHIAPFDGPPIGIAPIQGPEQTNNLSYREILFARTKFLKADGVTTLDNNIQVDSVGTEVTTNFKIFQYLDFPSLPAGQIKVEFIRTIKAGGEDKATYFYDGATWKFDGAPAPTWPAMNAPVIQIGAVAGVSLIHFEGSFKASRLHSEVKIKVILNNVDNIQLGMEMHQVTITEAAAVPAGGAGAGIPELFPQSHFFCDVLNVTPQTVAQAYGPVDGNKSNQYRVTSKFSAPADLNAYAAVDGFAFLQPGAAANLVNLVIRPYRQGISGLHPVRYFVYRGLLKDDFLNPADDTKVVPQAATNSKFIEKQWIIHNDQNASGTAFLAKALGYDPTVQTPASLLDTYFFRMDDDYQLPFIRKGDQIGKFFSDSGNADFGLDILIAGSTFDPTLAYIRQPEHLVDVSVAPYTTDAFLKKIKREEIRNFIDPAAYWGMHLTDKGYVQIDNAGTTEKKDGQSIYTDIIDKFSTSNKLYIDIRNESSFYSYNFFDNYGTNANNVLKIGNNSSGLSNKGYATDQWPIIIRETTQNTTDDTNKVYVQLRKNENPDPVLYVEAGKLETPSVKGRFVLKDDINANSQVFTKAVGFSYPNTSAGSGNSKLNVASLISMYYGRLISAVTSWPNEVVRVEKYTDNLLGPIDIEPLWTEPSTEVQVSWRSLQDRLFVDGGAGNFRQTVERFVGFDGSSGGRVVFFTTTVESLNEGQDILKSQGGMSSGLSWKDSLFKEKFLTKGFDLFFDVIDDNGTEVQTLNFQYNPDLGDVAVSASNKMVCGLMQTEVDTLKALTGLSDKYGRYIYFEELSTSPGNSNGKTFYKYKVGLQGKKTDGTADIVYPSTDIIIYSVDELFFFTKAFAEAEPLPTVYKRNYEENIGQKEKHMTQTFVIKAVSSGDKQITVQGTTANDDLNRKDEVIVGSTTYTVEAISTDAGNTVITVLESISGSTTVGANLKYLAINWEDFLINADRNTAVAGSNMKQLVTAFEGAVAGVTYDPDTSEAALQALVDLHAPKILTRARAVASDNAYADADDRPLYWARIKMLVALKSHEFCLKSISGRNRLVDSFESLSRGWNNADFSSVPSGVKKVLVSGFDPFFLHPDNGNPLQSNPSGSAALALHGKTIMDGSTAIAYVQAGMFPVRYRDFDNEAVEQFFKQYIDPGEGANYKETDMVMTLSQALPEGFWVDRFAARFRHGTRDNENISKKTRPNLKISEDIPGSEFYETTLPFEKIVPVDNILPNDYNYAVFYNNFFRYVVFDSSNNEIEFGYYDTAIDGIEKLENRDPSYIGSTPNTLDETTIPKLSEIKSREGSGGNYLSNEIFYRVARLRTMFNSNLPTGHFHVPSIQGGKDFPPTKNKDLIDDIEVAIKKAMM